MAGTLTATTIQNDTSSPPTFRNNSIEIGQLCRAWVNFNGSTSTIRGSFNVGSITKNGTGLYTINFTTAMPNINYSVNVTAGNPFNSVAGEMIGLVGAPSSTTSFQVRNATTGSSYDTSIACVAVFSS